MADDPEPPRKFYQLKPKDFERVNRVPGASVAPVVPAPDAGPAPIDDRHRRIDVRELIRQGAAGAPLLSANQPANRPNEVHGVLKDKFEHDRAHGLFHVEPGDDKERRQRIRNYWLLLVLVDAPFLWLAWKVNPLRGLGPASAIVFTCAIAGFGMFTAWWTWHNWFLRTER